MDGQEPAVDCEAVAGLPLEGRLEAEPWLSEPLGFLIVEPPELGARSGLFLAYPSNTTFPPTMV